MYLRIPFFKNKTLVIKIKLEISYDEILLAILKNRFQNPVNKKWRLNKIDAFKFYRGNTELSLRKSMDYVNKLIEKNHLEIETDYCEIPAVYNKERYKG